MDFSLSVRNTSQVSTDLLLHSGSSTFFVGANGSGKTRLAVKAESDLGEKAHRISAHRSLSLNPSVEKISEGRARAGLRFGNADTAAGQEDSYRRIFRWAQKSETILLNDFDFLVQTLFADQSNIALQTHNAVHAGITDRPAHTLLQKLTAIWGKVLPHRALKITGDDISVTADGSNFYGAAQMSDGERSVFYMLGQVLVAVPDSVLIFDEPELHVHRAILGRLWDEVEAARPDCAFLVITHDLEFAASRPGQKFVIQRYQSPDQWDIESVPENTGFSEDIATLILGSRKPILFVEGTGASLDVAIYRACYPEWTVVPRGSSEDVFRAVTTMRSNADLTRITCAGIVDADDYSNGEKDRLAKLGVEVLPVSEIENLFLLPDVATAILEEEKFQGDEVGCKLDSLAREIIDFASRRAEIDAVVMRFCLRRIDRALKKMDLTTAATTEDLKKIFDKEVSAFDIEGVAEGARNRVNEALNNSDIPALLANFDNKALFALAARHLKGTNKREFVSWLTRAMRDPRAERLKLEIRKVLPTVTAK